MYIKMDNSKHLVISSPSKIYRGENNADDLIFLLPTSYNGIDLSKCKTIVRYLLPNGQGCSVSILNVNQIEDYLVFGMSVDTTFTTFAGRVVLWITMTNSSDEVVLKTSELTFEVEESKDITTHFEDNKLDQLDNIQIDISKLDSNKADNIVYSEVENTLQLTSHGVPIGDKIHTGSMFGVLSWNGRKGDVSPQHNDYSYEQINGLESQLDTARKGVTYVHKQRAMAKDWHIQHNLNRFPSVAVIDSAGTTVIGEIYYEDNNNLTIKFTSAFSGTAYLN